MIIQILIILQDISYDDVKRAIRGCKIFSQLTKRQKWSKWGKGIGVRFLAIARGISDHLLYEYNIKLGVNLPIEKEIRPT